MLFKSRLYLGSAAAIAGCAGFIPPVHSASLEAVAEPDVVWFTGASNIRHFICGSQTVTVLTKAAPNQAERAVTDGIPAVSGATLTLPVLSLDCGLAKMNHDLLETLGSDRNPTINFRLWDYVVLTRGSPGSVRMNGLLRLAGKEQTMVIYGNVFRRTDGELRLRGERIIDVRDFGIQAPKRFFGMFHVRNEITVHFDVAVKPVMDLGGVLATTGIDPEARQ